MSKNIMNDLLTCAEAGVILGIGAHAIRCHVRRGALPLALERPRCWLVYKKDVLALGKRLAGLGGRRGRPKAVTGQGDKKSRQNGQTGLVTDLPKG